MSDNSNGSGGVQLTPWTLKSKICCMGQELECHETKTFKSSSFMTVQIPPGDESFPDLLEYADQEGFGIVLRLIA